MSKIFSVIILLFLFISFYSPMAQAGTRCVKIYSGYLHKINLKNKEGFLHTLRGFLFPDKGFIEHGMQCSIEFKSPFAFFSQSITNLPDKLSYTISLRKALKFPVLII